MSKLGPFNEGKNDGLLLSNERGADGIQREYLGRFQISIVVVVVIMVTSTAATATAIDGRCAGGVFGGGRQRRRSLASTNTGSCCQLRLCLCIRM